MATKIVKNINKFIKIIKGKETVAKKIALIITFLGKGSTLISFIIFNSSIGCVFCSFSSKILERFNSFLVTSFTTKYGYFLN